MIGIIAGELIGSPYRKENIPDVNGIFFPLFEDNRVMDPKSFRERTYKVTPGRCTDAVLTMDRAQVMADLSGESLGEALCRAIVTGRMNAALKMDFDSHEEVTGNLVKLYPESMSRQIAAASDAAYRLERKMGTGIAERLGYLDQKEPALMSAILKGQLVPDHDGTFVPGDGKFSDGNAFEGACCAVVHSRSWEEAVRRAVALGGDSALTAALAGGLAEIAFGIPERIEFLTREHLDGEQLSQLRQGEERMRRMVSGGEENFRKEVKDDVHLVSVLSLPGRAKVYSVPEDRPDIERAIRKVNPDSVFVQDSGLRRMMERLEKRHDAAGNRLDGTFIDSERPELRTLYFRTSDRKFYSPSTLPEGRGFTPLDMRMKTRSEFAQFVVRASAVRDEQERKVGHDPSVGHLRFETAWYLDIQRTRVRLMKGGLPYGEFGIDKNGRMRVDVNVVGGSFGGEYLQAALDNQRVFFKNDGPAEVLSKIQEKCLDAGFIPDEEGVRRSNIDLMLEDLSRVNGDIPVAAHISEEELKGRTTATHARNDYGGSSEARTFDEAIYSRMHGGAVFTIGHSNLPIGEFVANLRRNGITTVRDVRSWPQSRNYPQYNKENLRSALEKEGIRYVFNGDVMGGHVRRTSLPSEAEGVRFTMSDGGYAQRTRENASAADLTIAFAADFSTAGEKATEKAAAGKIIQIPMDKENCDAKAMAADILSCMTDRERKSELEVNVAGNGMQTFAQRGLSREQVASTVAAVMRELVERHGLRIAAIRSGGQTGADEAGILAAKELCIPAHVHAPKGWLMRGEDGKDVFSEYAFKERFVTMPAKGLSYEEMVSTEGFRKVYDEIVSDARKGDRQAIMCAETSPSDCHRYACIGYALSHPALVGRRYAPTEVQHIKRDGSTIAQDVLERKACRDAGVEYNDTELKTVMKRAGERLQHPNPDEKGIRITKDVSHQGRRR